MKNLSFILVLMLCITAFAFSKKENGTVKGRVVPYNAAINVWAVSDKDTVKTVVQAAGEFELKNVKPGMYRIIVEGQKPYKTTTKPNVSVNGGYVDIGDIILDQAY